MDIRPGDILRIQGSESLPLSIPVLQSTWRSGSVLCSVLVRRDYYCVFVGVLVPAICAGVGGR